MRATNGSGPIGTNKSQALQTLAVRPEWFSDNLPLGLPAKKTIEALSGLWIVEISELQGIRKSDIDKVKAFASRGTDRARMAYDRTVTEARRQCIIIGTTNSEQYLRDLTGNRRFWPVRVVQFNLEALERDRDQQRRANPAAPASASRKNCGWRQLPSSNSA
jgi:predicted P-loop ATPase